MTELHRPVEIIVEQIRDFDWVLGRFMAALTPKQKVVVFLLLEGMSIDEIGQEVGLSRQAIQGRKRGVETAARGIWGDEEIDSRSLNNRRTKGF